MDGINRILIWIGILQYSNEAHKFKAPFRSQSEAISVK